jgi:DNA-binding NarL/FixJ family response regulator
MPTTQVLISSKNYFLALGVLNALGGSGSIAATNIVASIQTHNGKSLYKTRDCILLTTLDDVLDIMKEDKGYTWGKSVVLAGSLATGQLSVLLESGVSGLVCYNSDPEVLIKAIDSVARGTHYIDACYSSSLTEMVLSSNSGSHPTISKLTKQEYIVATELSTGASNRIIAHRLGLSEKSIKAYLTSIFSKLSVRNRVEAALLLRETICKSSMAA